MIRRLLAAACITTLVACAGAGPVGSFDDQVGRAAIGIKTAALTLGDLCLAEYGGGPCAEGALISTADRDLVKRNLQDAQDVLEEVYALYHQGAVDVAESRLVQVRRSLAIAESILRRYE